MHWVRAKTVKASTEEQKNYFKLVFNTQAPERDKVEAALEKAHEIRQFEIRLYWQRSLFFWGFILTFFGAYMLLFSQEDLTFFVILALLIIAIIGLYASFAWYYVEVGSASWQKNWELHIDFLENHITGRLHKTVLGVESRFFSLATILRHFIVMVGVAWFALLGLAGYLLGKSVEWECLHWFIAIFSYLALFLSLLIIKPNPWRTSTKTTLVKPPQEVLITLSDEMFTDGKPEKFTFFQRDFPEVKRSSSKKLIQS